MNNTSSLREQMLQEAIRIGDHLLVTAEEADDGLTWRTVVFQQSSPAGFVYSTCDNAYNGVCGICLFLLELYHHTGQDKYLQAAIRGMKWVTDERRSDHDTNFALYTGKMSIAHVLIRFHKITKDASFLQQAMQIALASEHAVTFPVYDLINGISGTLLALMHVHAASQDIRLLKIINLYTGKLLNAMHIGKSGVYWDRNDINMHGLCGFSHGASGLGYVFMELAFYFSNPAFYEIARQAFIYERQFFSEASQNWRDLRGADEKRFNVEIDQAYAAGDKQFFTKEKYMNAWCHGAAGIGLSRIRAIETLPDGKVFENELAVCIRTTYHTTVKQVSERDSSCLCHGNAGNAELFLEAYRLFKNESYLQLAYKAAANILTQKETLGRYTSGNPGGVEDNSLFMGNAGVGYFLLRVIEPDRTPSLLGLRLQHPCNDLVSPENSWLCMTPSGLHQQLVATAFKRTLTLSKQLFPEKVDDYFNETSARDFMPSWIAFVTNLILQPHPNMDILEDAFNLEHSAYQLDLSIESDNLLFIKDRKKKADKINLLSDTVELEELTLSLDCDLIIIRTNWPWSLQQAGNFERNIKMEPGEFYCLLVPTYLGIMERQISEFTKMVLEVFEQPLQVSDAITIIAKSFEDHDELKVRQLILHQVRELINAGFLLDPAKHVMNRRNRSLVEEILIK